MELACTKKVLEYLGVAAEKLSENIDPLFSWSANLILIDRRKTLVVVHGGSRCGFVLHGLTKKNLRELPELVLQGIRNMLESEYVRGDIVDRYLDELGCDIHFCSNTSRKSIAHCNKFCEQVQLFAPAMRAGDLFQRHILPGLNNNASLTRDCAIAYVALIAQLQQRYGETVQACRALELEVTLDLHTPCKRRIIVPEDLNFKQLHFVLQKCFCWEDRHLHQFVTEVDEKGRLREIIIPQEFEVEDLPGVRILDSEGLSLWEVFSTRKHIIYEYDFGDGWMHLIRLVRVIEEHPQPYPQCTLVSGEAPPEDCGGAEGYAHLQAVLNDPTHPEYQELSQWAAAGWRYKQDIQWINAWVKDAHRRLWLT